MGKGYDVRAVANIVLDEAWKHNLKITNLHLNKILYFMQVECLRDFGKPLTSARIEAWDYGPVFREVYRQFKVFRRNPITALATKVDFDSGNKEIAKEDFGHPSEDYIRGVAMFYSRVPVRILVDMSHASGGAWDKVWNHKDDFNVGMEITEQLLTELEVPERRRIKLQ